MSIGCSEIILGLKILSILIALFAAVITVSTDLYLKMARIFDRRYWKASGAINELIKKGKVSKSQNYYWLIRLTGLDYTFRKVSWEEVDKDSAIGDLSTTGNSMTREVRLDHRIVMNSSPTANWALFDQMYSNMIQSRQNQMSVIVLIFSVAIQLVLLIVNP